MPDDTPFLRMILDHPDEDAPRLVLADWLDEFYPATPVRREHVPQWLIRHWCKRRKQIDLPTWRAPYGGFHLSGWGCFDELATVLPSVLDHIGSTTIAGRNAFVTEPYLDQSSALIHARTMQSTLMLPVGIARLTAWNSPGCIRIAIFSPLLGVPE